MKVTPSIEDLRQLARRKVPRAFFEFVDSGSYTEQTFRANLADLEAIKLRQRVMVNVDQRNLTTRILGEQAAAPIALGPIGLCGMQHGDGEILSARAAQAAGLPFTLSTMSICSIEDVAAAVSKPFWFQLYVMRDRGFIRELIQRAKAAKCSALVLTVDLQVLGQRHRDLRNGMTVPPKLTLGNLLEIARKPSWAMSILKGKRKTFGNLDGHLKGMNGIKVAGAMDQRAVRSAAELERRGMDPRPVGRQAHHKGHPRRRGREACGQDRRRRADRLQSWRPPTRRRAVFDLRCCREWWTPSAPRSR